MRTNRLKVLMISTSYPETQEDWHGRFIANLAAGLARHDSIKLYLWAPPGEVPQQATSTTTEEEKAWLQQLSRNGGIAHLLRQRKTSSAGAVIGLLKRLHSAYRRTPVDVAHVNWLQNALPLWGTKTPAIISVLGSDFGMLRLPGMKALLRTIFRQRHVILAPNAEWMRPALESAFGDLAEVHTIPFGVDSPWLEMQRDILKNDHHWLAVTRLTKNKIGDLLTWGEGLFGQERQLHLFGPMQENIALPAWIVHHGPTHPAELLSSWFPKATGLITLSHHDEGRPQVMLEAMAAGLPVIASNLPAHRDIIRHRQTGWIVDSTAEFREALVFLERPDNNQETGEAARAWIKENIGTWDDCATRYISAYHQLLERTA